MVEQILIVYLALFLVILAITEISNIIVWDIYPWEFKFLRKDAMTATVISAIILITFTLVKLLLLRLV